MATISLLSYNLSNGLKMKLDGSGNNNNNNNNNKATSSNKTFNKIIVHNVLTESNGNSLNISSSSPNANTIVKKIKDFGMIGSVTSSGNRSPCTVSGLIRKRPLKIMQLNETTKSAVTIIQPKKIKQEQCENSPSSNVPKVSHQQQQQQHQTSSGTPGRKGLPAPQAVARRNARERNRVKQVNNGFAALRDRIPEEIAASFEVQGNGRGSVKKLSKVETLRMAVEYIRNLEKLLGFEFSNSGSNKESSSKIVKEEFDINSPQSSFDDNNYCCEDSISNCEGEEENNHPNKDIGAQMQYNSPIDLLPNITTLNGLQYIRIPGTNTYQLISDGDIFIPDNNQSHFNALIGSDCMSPVGTTATTMDDTSVYPDEEMLARVTTPAINNNNFNECSSSPLPHHMTSSSSPNSAVALQLSPASSAHQRSPAGNEILQQTCNGTTTASNNNNRLLFVQQQQQQQQFHPRVKIEQIENSITGSTTTIIYDPLQQAHILMENSPPIDEGSTSAAIQLRYYDDQSRPFYEDVVTFKKETNDSTLETSMAVTSAAISDESMIDAIDWWEAHTPKSDNDSIII